MTPDEFRRYGHEVVDWLADYFAHPEQHAVLPNVEPGFLAPRLPPCAPEQGEPMDAILADFARLIVPGLTHWNHPRFFAYFSVTGSPPGVLAEMLAAGLNINHMVWKSGPSATELEQVTTGWLRQWLGLPEEFFGMIHDTASNSTLHGLAAAREQADPEARTHGASRGLVVYTSEQAHSSVEKSAIAIGIGQRNVRKIPVDECFRMRPDALEEAIRADAAQGLRPCCVVATVGTTSTTSVDPVPAVAEIAGRHGLWLHVDAAYGGAAGIVPEYAHYLAGCARADSLVMNPHKWMGTPVDLSVLFTRRPDVLRRAFALVPEYLRTSEDARALNYMDYSLPLGRRFRALKLWFVMRYYGREGIVAKLRAHIAWARDLARRIAAHPDYEICAPTPMSLVCFRRKGSDEDNRALLDRVNATGEAFLSHTVLNGRFVLRLAIGNYATTEADVERCWELIQRS
jgi:aromatic-L-amino-acid decarboxylase